MATCNGTACAEVCAETACSDASCSRLAWSFTSGSVDGVTAVAPAGLMLANRPQAGNPALAIDLTELTTISFTIPICLSGSLNLSTQTLSYRVFFDGGNPDMEQYYAQASVLGPSGQSYVGQLTGTQAGAWRTKTAPLSSATTSATTLQLQIDAGTFGGAFAGTIWFDDFMIE